ncbi:MAG: thioredoxin-like domain-containing protein [Flavobacteriaceae bacterium]
MRHLILLALLALAFVSCQNTEYTLNVSADVEDDQQVYLITLDDNNQPKTLDTLHIKEGVTSYSGSATLPEMHFLLLQGNRDVVPFVLEPGDITVEIYKDSIRSSIVRGTKSNIEFKRYITASTPLIDDLFAIQNEMRNAMISRDSLAFVDLKEQLDEMQTKFNDFQIDYVKSNPDAYISVLVLEQLIGNGILEKEAAVEVYNTFSNTLKKTKAGIKISKLTTPEPETEETSDTDEEVSVGDIAPDFTAPSVNGTPQTLYASLGEYTILDFWASWCGPCRVDSPNMVALHNKYKNKGLNIVGVSVDKDETSWKKAIENDKLAWTHVSHLKRWEDPIADAYGVNAIPQLFLLDKSGKVIAREDHAEDLIPILENIL